MNVPRKDIGSLTAKQPSILRQVFVDKLKSEIITLRHAQIEALQEADVQTAARFQAAFPESKNCIEEEIFLDIGELNKGDMDENGVETDQSDDGTHLQEIPESGNAMNDRETGEEVPHSHSEGLEPHGRTSTATLISRAGRTVVLETVSPVDARSEAKRDDHEETLQNEEENSSQMEVGGNPDPRSDAVPALELSTSSQTTVDRLSSCPAKPLINMYDTEHRSFIDRLVDPFRHGHAKRRMWYYFTQYLSLVHVARQKANVYPSFWGIDDISKPGEILGTSLTSILPDAAFIDIGLNPDRARDIVSLYMTTRAGSETEILLAVRGIESLEQLARSLRNPTYRPRPNNKLGLHGMILRTLFNHFHEWAESYGLITFAHLAKLEIALDKLRGLLKRKKESTVRTIAMAKRLKNRYRRSKNSQDMRAVMKNEGYQSPLSESISINEEWPEGWNLVESRLERRVIHGIKGVDVNNPLPPPSDKWEEEAPEVTTSKPRINLDKVKW